MNDSHTQRMMAPAMIEQYSRLMPVELTGAPIRYEQWPLRYWKKSQKKIRRERRQRMAYKKGGGK